tara:strand:+ start:3379 stop:4002 length:624 start_codon:yes stop_codon:yes gene_type:complete
MHKLNILIHGPESFLTTLNELKNFLNFNLIYNKNNLSEIKKDLHGFICHEECLKNEKIDNNFTSIDCFKILATSKKKIDLKNFDHILTLPTSIKEINNLIDNSDIKRQFNKNSSIKIKSYLLDKNEKKLRKENKFIDLTEKEIRLLEILLEKDKAISKNSILSLVWKYSSESDTHTVETHIYRLRKKINDKFSDDKFILNNKEGYFI